MKIIGWIFILVGVSGLVSYLQSLKVSELAASVIFILWGVSSILYKKYLVKRDIYIGARYLDGGHLVYGMFLIGIGIVDCFLLLEEGFPETTKDISGNVIVLLLFFLGGGLFIFKGYKKYSSTKKINSTGPLEG